MAEFEIIGYVGDAANSIPQESMEIVSRSANEFYHDSVQQIVETTVETAINSTTPPTP